MNLYPLSHPAGLAHSKAMDIVLFTSLLLVATKVSFCVQPVSHLVPHGWTSTMTQLWLHKHNGFEPLGMADLGG